MNVVMRSHLRGRKYKVCEIKLSICVVYIVGRRKLKKKKKKEKESTRLKGQHILYNKITSTIFMILIKNPNA